MTLLGRKCDWCGFDLVMKNYRKIDRFCSTKCAALWRSRIAGQKVKLTDLGRRSLSEKARLQMSTPEMREQSRRRFAEILERPGVRQKAQDHSRNTRQGAAYTAYLAAYGSSPDHPFKNTDIRRKGHETQRASGFLQLNYRKGSGPTAPQKILFDALPESTMEHRIQQHLTVDLAIIASKLAIEVDGQSHLSKEGKRLDTKRECILRELGWTLLRFRNKEILENLPSVLNRIEEAALELSELSRKGA